MKKIQDHKFLKILKFAFENDYFTQNEMCKALGLKADDFSNFSQMSGIVENAHQLDEEGNSRYKMRYDAFRNYLDYVELKDARKTAKSAKLFAIIAIIISAISPAVPVIIQIWHPTSLILIP